MNPHDKDYGAIIQSARLAAIEETFHNVLWWADVVFIAEFSVSLAVNYWQHRRSEDRLRISSAIAAQLYNSPIASQSKALDAIEKHNQLANMYNAKCDEEAGARETAVAAEQKRTAKGEPRSSPTQASKARSAVSVPESEDSHSLPDADDRNWLNAQPDAERSPPIQCRNLSEAASGPSSDESGVYNSRGIEQRGSQNRLLLVCRAEQSVRPDSVLVCARSAVLGRIPFGESWRSTGVEIVSASEYKG